MFEFHLNKVQLIADISGALFWPEKRTVIFSDLHLEKGSWFAKQNVPLPPYDTVDTLDRIEQVINDFNPIRIISIGDSFHDEVWSERITERQRQRILNLVREHEWIWIQGNHDPSGAPSLGGISVPEYFNMPLTFRHEAKENLTVGEVSGHYHPKAKIRLQNKNFTARCFITDGSRIILPAFGSFTGGLNVMNSAIMSLFTNEIRIFLLGSKIRQFPKAALLA